MNIAQRIEAAIVAGYQRVSDTILEARIAFANWRLARCQDHGGAHRLCQRVVALVKLRSPGQVRRMEARKGLR
jgi:hypothetical protein